jgi:hypothetical protein
VQISAICTQVVLMGLSVVCQNDDTLSATGATQARLIQIFESIFMSTQQKQVVIKQVVMMPG